MMDGLTKLEINNNSLYTFLERRLNCVLKMSITYLKHLVVSSYKILML